MSLVQRDYAEHGIDSAIVGHVCSVCQKPRAAHKIGEELPADLTGPAHNLTNWLCCLCFRQVVGTAHDTFPYDNILE